MTFQRLSKAFEWRNSRVLFNHPLKRSGGDFWVRLLTFSAQILFKSLVSQKPKRNVENGRSKPIHLSTLPVAALVLLQRCVCVCEIFKPIFDCVGLKYFWDHKGAFLCQLTLRYRKENSPLNLIENFSLFPFYLLLNFHKDAPKRVGLKYFHDLNKNFFKSKKNFSISL